MACLYSMLCIHSSQPYTFTIAYKLITLNDTVINIIVADLETSTRMYHALMLSISSERKLELTVVIQVYRPTSDNDRDSRCSNEESVPTRVTISLDVG